MLQTLAITSPIYLVIALGFTAVRSGIFSSQDMRVFGTYVARFALPALVFTALSQRPINDILDARYLIGYGIASLAVMAGSFIWSWRVQGKGVSLSALCSLGMSSSNSGYVGYPVAVQVVGAGPAAVGLAMCMIVENLIMIPLALIVADSGQSTAGSWKRALMESLRQIVRNPVVIAIAAGFIVGLLHLAMPGILVRTVGMIAASSTAVSLFVIGGSLVGLQLKGMRRDVTVIALGKLLIHPLAVGLMVWFVLPPADRTMRIAAIVFGSAPMIGIYPILAQKYGYNGFCAAALLLATLLSFVTISLILAALGSVTCMANC